MAERNFAQRLEGHDARIAIISSDSSQWTYAALAQAADRAAASLRGEPAPVIVETANTVECIVAYLACLRAGFPVLLAEPGSTARDPRIAETFRAAWVFRAADDGAWRFEPYCQERVPVHPELCLLLSTSGSTGSPQLVRLSHANIDSNAASIAEYLGLAPDDRALTSLPAFYPDGMSVINSHLAVGACLLLTEESVAQEGFWLRAEREHATSFAGVPFTYEILERIGFRSRRYPSLRYLTQAGGRLSAEMVGLYAEWAENQDKRFFVMYGQTEAAPRMAYVPPAQLRGNAECIGVPIPGGSFELLRDDGTLETCPDQPGELVYRGPNVMMGYAGHASDLALGKVVDELRTGDLACRKANGNYYIAGRMSRFVKLAGKRISLDEIERWLEQQGVPAAVGGNDEVIAVAVARNGDPVELKQRLVQHFGLPAIAVEAAVLDPLPTLASGKIDHRSALRLVREACRQQMPDKREAMPVGALETLHQAAPRTAAANTPAPFFLRTSFKVAAAVALSVLVAGEGALQLRSYLKTGRSAAALLTGQSTVVFNQRWGVSTYRPNHVLAGGQEGRHFATNSLGLRSPEIRPEPVPGEVRLAVVGASSVAGAYALRNSDTFPSLLEQKLRTAHPKQRVNVINAGIEGHTLSDSNRLIEHVVASLRPSTVIVYPGFNDMAGICHASRGLAAQARQPLPVPSMPRWTLSASLVAKNTVALREPAIKTNAVDPAKYFPSYYGEILREIVRKARAQGIEPVLMTVARAFEHSSRQDGMRLAETALYWNSCLDYDGLVKAGHLYNQAISTVAAKEKVTLLDLASVMPGGRDYFVDAGHFTARGEQFVAEYLARELADRGLASASVQLGSR